MARLLVLAAACAAALSMASPGWTAAPRELVFRSAGAPPALPTVLPPPPSGTPMHWVRGPARPGDGFPGGRAIVGLAAADDAAQVAADHGVTAVRVETALRALEVTGSPEALRALASSRDPRIRYVESPPPIRFEHYRDDPWVNRVDVATGMPYEWTFAQLGVDKAFNLSHGSPEILVGVVDSGVSNVPDLTGKIAQTFWDPAETSADDPIGHGTFVSSLIAANDDDGVGLAGFCGACRLIVYRIDTFLDVAAAIEKLVDEGVRVINLSLGFDPSDPAYSLHDAVDYAGAHGVLVVASSGNEQTQQVDYPAADLQPAGGGPGAGLAIGASDEHGAPLPWSNDGQQLSLLAPGGYSTDDCLGVFGAVPDAFGIFDLFCDGPFVEPATGARYTYGQGTSFSSPEVAGLAALAWAAAPNLKSADIVRLMTQTATRPAGTGWTPETGWGVVDAARLLEAVTGRSSADRLVVSHLAAARPAAAGKVFQLSLRAAWSDGIAPHDGSVACSAAAGAARMKAATHLVDGLGVCQWRIPAAAGRRMTGTVRVTNNGVTGTATFAYAVHPAVR